VLLVAQLAACGGNRARTDTSEGDYATVRVENNSTRDVRVYLRPGAGGARFHLGRANALQATGLRVPRTMVVGISELTFEIVPLAGGGSQFSEKVTVRPGEEILLRIPP
jgi:hypothetical protein